MNILYAHTVGAGVAEARMHMQGRLLRTMGHDVKMFPEWEHYFGGMRTVHGDRALDEFHAHWEWADIVHAQYNTELSQIEAHVQARAKHGKPLIVDLDDDLFHVPPYNTAYRSYHAASNKRNIASLSVRVADAITVSTPAIKVLLETDREAYPDKWAYRKDAPIVVLPNLDDPPAWATCIPDPAAAYDKSVRILFAGGQGRYGDLDVCRAAIEGVMDSTPNVRLFFIGCMPDWAAKWMPSSTDPSANRCFYVQGLLPPTYRAALTWFRPDIMLCPVQANEFNRSKSSLKVYEAAHAGAVVLCTDYDTYADVPSNCAIKVDNTTTQWRGALDALVGDANLRHSLNTRLREWVATRSVQEYISDWLAVYEQALGLPEGGL